MPGRLRPARGSRLRAGSPAGGRPPRRGARLLGRPARRGGVAAARRRRAGALLYPFLVPMFLPEFGRLGNDSLCMFLVGAAWTALLRVIAEPRRMRAAIGLGMVLGMGLLTKAFFLAIGAGVGAYLLNRSAAARADRPLAKQLLRQALTVAAVALAIGGWWYVYKFLAFDSVTGGEVLINLDAQG